MPEDIETDSAIPRMHETQDAVMDLDDNILPENDDLISEDDDPFNEDDDLLIDDDMLIDCEDFDTSSNSQDRSQDPQTPQQSHLNRSMPFDQMEQHSDDQYSLTIPTHTYFSQPQYSYYHAASWEAKADFSVNG